MLGDVETGNIDDVRVILRLRRIDDSVWIRVANPEEPRLHKEVPDSTGLVDIDLDKVASLTSPQLATAASVFSNQGLFDDEIGLRENA